MRLNREDGFSLVATVMALTVCLSISVAAFAAAGGDLRLTRADQDQKRALAAAEAGLHDYLFRLNQDNAFWSYCANAPGPSPVNAYWDGTGPQPNWKWRTVPGSAARYRIEILPAPGAARCEPGQDATAIDPANGVLRIRATGESRGRSRTLVASLRRRGFLDYLYFTDNETADPTQYEINVDGAASRNPDLVTWASTQCDKHYREGRRYVGVMPQYYPGQVNMGSVLGLTGVWLPPGPQIMCSIINFIGGDVVAGPFHTNDEFVTCGGRPVFGRSRSAGDDRPRDEISFSGPEYFPCDSSSAPDFGNNIVRPNAPELTLPPTNAALQATTDPAYRFRGRTTIVLQNDRLVVTNPTMGLDNAVMAWPTNGVVYVANETCAQGYRVLSPYSASEGCGDVYLRGTYTKSLTIGAEKDIVVNGDVVNGADALLGLIANNFVRVYHPLTQQARAAACAGPSGPSSWTVPQNAPGTMQNVRIDAAILSLLHVFTVDNYQCGQKLGTLTVNGTIGQKFRGPVGRTGANGAGTGYTKDYHYDDRLRYRAPPHFLDPVQSAWRIVRQTEQSSAP